jgi:hypothetical protein
VPKHESQTVQWLLCPVHRDGCSVSRPRSGVRCERLAAGNLEGVLGSLDKDKYPVPEPFPFEEARHLFKGAHPGQTPPC